MSPPAIPLNADERTMLKAFLDSQRAAMLDVVEGLNAEQLNTYLEPSTLTLGGLMHHMAYVEDWWFSQVLGGNEPVGWSALAPWDEDRDWEFHVAPELAPDVIKGRYREAIAVSRGIEAATASLDVQTERQRDGEPFSLRWILIHMIEETARHAGHGDLIRESIDGKTAS